MTCRSVVETRNMCVLVVLWVAVLAGGVRSTLVPYILGDTTIMVDGSALGYNSPLLAHLRNGMPLRRGSGSSSSTYTDGAIVDNNQNQEVGGGEEQGQVMTWDPEPYQAPQEHLTSNSDFLATPDGMLDINIVPQHQEAPSSDPKIYSGRPPPIPNAEPAGLHFNEDLAFANSPPFYYSVENPDISQVSQKIHHIVTLLSHKTAGVKPNDRAPIPLAETLDYPVQSSDSSVNRPTAITNNEGFAGVSVIHMVPKDSDHHDANFANPGDYNPLLSSDPGSLVPGAEVVPLRPYDPHEHFDSSQAASDFSEHWSPNGNHVPSFSQIYGTGSNTLATPDQGVLNVLPPPAQEIASHDTDISGQPEGQLGLEVASDARLSDAVLGESQGLLHKTGGPQIITQVEVTPNSDIIQTTVTTSTGPRETVTDTIYQRQTVTDSTVTWDTVTDLQEINTGSNDEYVTGLIDQRYAATELTTQQETITDSSVLQVTLASDQEEIVTDVSVRQQITAGSNNTLNHDEMTGQNEGTTEGSEGEDSITEATQPPTEHPLNMVLEKVLSHTLEKLKHEEAQDNLHGATEQNDQLALNQAMADLLGNLFTPNTDSSDNTQDEVDPQASDTTDVDNYSLEEIGQHRDDLQQTFETSTLPYEEHTYQTNHALAQNDGDYLQTNFGDEQSTSSVTSFNGDQEEEEKDEGDAWPASEDRPHALASDQHNIPNHYPYPILTDFPLTRGEPETVEVPLQVSEGGPSHYSPGLLITGPTTQEQISDTHGLHEDDFLSRHEPPRPDDDGLNTWFDRDPISIFDPLHSGSSGANTGMPQGILVSGTNTEMLPGTMASGTNTGTSQATLVPGTNIKTSQDTLVSGTVIGMSQGSTTSGIGVPELRPAPGHPFPPLSGVNPEGITAGGGSTAISSNLPPLPGVDPEKTSDFVGSTIIPSNLLLLLDSRPGETTNEGPSTAIPSNLPPLPGVAPEGTSAGGGSTAIPSNLPPLPGVDPEGTSAGGGSTAIPSNLPPLPGVAPEGTSAGGGSTAIPSNLPPLPGVDPEGTSAGGGSTAIPSNLPPLPGVAPEENINAGGSTGSESPPEISDTVGDAENGSGDNSSHSSNRNETKSSVFDGAVFHSVHPELIQKSSCRCGLRLTSKIVGGQPTDINQFPWMGAIVTASTGFTFCGGSVINDRYMLTAGHCVNGRQPSDLMVRLGETTRSGGQGILIPVQEVILHPKYTSSAVTHFDIALVKLSHPIEFSERVLPVCLSSGKNKYSNEQAIVSGWGRNQFGGSVSEGLQEVSVRVLSTKDCRRNSEYMDTEVHNRVLCAAAEGKDACQGDSGGPLVHLNGDQYTQIGIVSWGIGCADNKYPGIYTRISAFNKWILSNAIGGRACQGSLFRTEDLHAVKDDTEKEGNKVNIKDQNDNERTGVDSFIDSILKPNKQKPVSQFSLTIGVSQDGQHDINKKNKKRKRPNQSKNNTRNKPKPDEASPGDSEKNNNKRNKNNNRRKNNKNKGDEAHTNNQDNMKHSEEITETEISNNTKNKTRNKGNGNRRKNDKYIGNTRNRNRNKNRNKANNKTETDGTKPANENTQTNNKGSVNSNKNNNRRTNNKNKDNTKTANKDKVEEEDAVDWTNITQALRAIATIIRKEATAASATNTKAD
nr:uncharacterized protein LOC123763169 [Procambarus clarkii]